MIEYESLKNSNKQFFEEYTARFKTTLESGWYVLGNEVKLFEESFAKYCQTNHCVGVANGLDAIMLSLRALELPKGSDVLVPSNTYIATILAILQCGLNPVPVEPRLSTYNINPDLLENVLTKNTSALVVVHLYGKACEMDAIKDFCLKHQLGLVEDCAQAHGASVNGKRIGSFGLGAFSFYPTKNLGCLGDGGSVNTNNIAVAEKIRMLRNYGSKVKYHNEIIGFNSRLDEIQAAFLNVKLKYLDDITAHKKQIAKIYNSSLKSDFIKPLTQTGYEDVFHIYNIRHEKRDQLKEFLLKNEVKTEIHYPIPPNKQKALDGLWNSYELPVAEEIHATTLSLPVSYGTSFEEAEKVAEILNRF